MLLNEMFGCVFIPPKGNEFGKLKAGYSPLTPRGKLDLICQNLGVFL